ncbi:MAG: bifunctional riboflavin kinase/FAD synthetase [Deltaproteobacteria bacterium]|nr:bifunctional riboflavin kinase/FAD synthetase [Deltaproteobacteria bacterium]
MRVFQKPSEAAAAFPGAIMALGNFDGVHLGHRALFEVACQQAKDRNQPWGVVTFEPHPARVLAPELAPRLITTPQGKLDLIRESAPDLTLVLPFTQGLSRMTPDQFVNDVLVRQLRPSALVVGHDFTFGSGRAGTVSDLRDMAATHDFQVHVLDPFAIHGMVVSSTKVRAFVLSGRVYAASLLLGRPFVLTGPVIRGDGRGKTIGFPTANIDAEQELLPSAGVYACWFDVKGHHMPAAVNVGRLPTFRADGILTVEAHVLDWSGDLYGQRVSIEFVRRIRQERRFASPDELAKQIQLDLARTREVLLKL